MSRRGSTHVERWQATSEHPCVVVESSPELPLAQVVVAQRTGSTADPHAKEGLVQLAARLMRRTAGGLPPHELERRVDSLGATLSVDTGRSTVMFQGVTISRSLDAFVDVLTDVFGRPGLSLEEFDRLKRETEAELIESRDDDRSLVRRAFRRHVFESDEHTRPVSGTVSSIRRICHDDVHSVVQRTWLTGNVVIAFAGDVALDHAKGLADRIGTALRPGAPLPDGLPEPSVPPGRRLVVVDKPERTQTQVLIGGLGTLPSDEDHVALHVANTAFGGTFSARMTREIRSKRGWSYGAYSSLPFDRYRQPFSMWTFPKATDAPACVSVQLSMLEEWNRTGITRAELAQAKRYLVRSHAFAVDTAAKRVGLALEAELYALPPRYHEDYLERVKAVTLDQANRAVQQRLSPANLLVTVVGTASEIVVPLQDAIRDLSRTLIIPFDADD